MIVWIFFRSNVKKTQNWNLADDVLGWAVVQLDWIGWFDDLIELIEHEF